MLNVIVLGSTFFIVILSPIRYAEYRYAECHYAEYCYAGCRGADVKIHAPSFVNIRENVV
jgi:hypothetical protein